jgi:hypothetical protein
MPGTNGVGTTRGTAQAAPETQITMVTIVKVFGDNEPVFPATGAGTRVGFPRRWFHPERQTVSEFVEARQSSEAAGRFCAGDWRIRPCRPGAGLMYPPRVRSGARSPAGVACPSTHPRDLRDYLARRPVLRCHRQRRFRGTLLGVAEPELGREAHRARYRLELGEARVLDAAVPEVGDVGAGDGPARGLLEVLPAPPRVVWPAVDGQQPPEPLPDMILPALVHCPPLPQAQRLANSSKLLYGAEGRDRPRLKARAPAVNGGGSKPAAASSAYRASTQTRSRSAMPRRGGTRDARRGRHAIGWPRRHLVSREHDARVRRPDL